MRASYKPCLGTQCPACGQEPGKPCIRVNALPGEEDELKFPHRERVEAANPPVSSTCYGCGASVFDRRPRILCGSCMQLPPHIQQRIRAARSRGIRWALSAAQAQAIVAQPCRYCGGPGGTIDRIDSSGDYSPENVAPACHTCNSMKAAATIPQWKAHMKRILAHLGES